MGGKDKNVTEHPANSGVFLLVRNVKQPCDGYLPHLGVDSPSKTATILPPVCSVILSYREPSMIRQSLQRIQDELRKLGFPLAKRTVARYVRQVHPSQPPRKTAKTWGTFLKNHAHET